jgi:2-phosphosulfolactate phosphatase
MSRKLMKEGNQKKLHVVLSKEEIDMGKIDAGKVAVVFDVLLATTTISALLHYGAKRIIPVMDGAEALHMKKILDDPNVILAGEANGKTIEGFFDPIAARLKDFVAGKTVILSTTNGTVAIRKVASAKKIYAASLLNAAAVGERIIAEHIDDTIIAVCAGSGGQFCLEDFYGAGFFINELLAKSDSWELTDSAKAALFFYQGNQDRAAEILTASRTGAMMVKQELLADILFASEKGTAPIVPQLEDGKLVLQGQFKQYTR